MLRLLLAVRVAVQVAIVDVVREGLSLVWQVARRPPQTISFSQRQAEVWWPLPIAYSMLVCAHSEKLGYRLVAVWQDVVSRAGQLLDLAKEFLELRSRSGLQQRDGQERMIKAKYCSLPSPSSILAVVHPGNVGL
jgi:hypothetical protein